MGDLSESLSRHEFECECGCGFDTVDYNLVCSTQEMVDAFGGAHIIRIEITGPNRCRKHNDSLRDEYVISKGSSGANTAENSMHITGKAEDFKLFYRNTGKQISPTKVYKYLNNKYPDRYGIKLYHNRVHFDVRSKMWRSA